MVTVKFVTEKMNKGQFAILPTIVVEKDDNSTDVLFAWIKGIFAVSVEKGSKKNKSEKAE